MNFDEEPEGDPHGECADEIHKLQAEVKELILERNAAWAEKKRNGERAIRAELQNGVFKGALEKISGFRAMVQDEIKFGEHDYYHGQDSMDIADDVLKHTTNNSCRQQTEKDWWGWGWKELSGKTSEQLEAQAKKVAATYEWSLSKERVIELLLKGKH